MDLCLRLMGLSVGNGMCVSEMGHSKIDDVLTTGPDVSTNHAVI